MQKAIKKNLTAYTGTEEKLWAQKKNDYLSWFRGFLDFLNTPPFPGVLICTCLVYMTKIEEKQGYFLRKSSQKISGGILYIASGPQKILC